jgi:guanosine-3',5'-bis(diphosphate) 3'-pyrophosphohydrolase
MEELLEKVREYADQAHGGQTRKYSSDRYIVHPIRVMNICHNFTKDVCILSAALLHDVLEDTSVKPHEMKQFLLSIMEPPNAERTMKLVVELTDVYVKKDYPQWNRHKRKEMELKRLVGSSADSQTIKYADILDNCREIVQHDRQFAKLFLNECRKILHQLDRGDQELRQQALASVEEGLSLLKTQYSG